MSDQWYYTENGQRRGPVSEDDLKQLVVSGRLKPTDLVWKEGMTQWVAASTISSLSPSSTEDEPPPLSPEDEPPPLEDVVPAPASHSRKSSISLALGALLLVVVGVGVYVYMHGGDQHVAKSDAIAPRNSAEQVASSGPQSSPASKPVEQKPMSSGTAQAAPMPAKSAPPAARPVSPLEATPVLAIKSEAPATPDDSLAAQDIVEFRGHFFKVFLTTMSWDEAKEHCQQLNGHLAYVTDAATFNFLANLKGTTPVWVGGRRGAKGEWHWLDGTKFEPDLSNNVSKYGYLAFGATGYNTRPLNGHVELYPNKDVQGYICEWDSRDKVIVDSAGDNSK